MTARSQKQVDQSIELHRNGGRGRRRGATLAEIEPEKIGETVSSVAEKERKAERLERRAAIESWYIEREWELR